jgi:hypothetical protein
MLDALGVLGFVVYIACVIAFASGVTWIVVRYSPTKKPPTA